MNEDRMESFVDYEKKYKEYDSTEIPGILFLHYSILELYGECPYINIFNDNHDLDSEMFVKRKKWLENQKDKGEMYYVLYKNIILKKKLIEITTELNLKDESINTYINTIISSYDKELTNMWDNTKILCEDYTKKKIKNKLTKEKLKNIIFNLRTIYIKTHINFYKYLSIKYNIIFESSKESNDDGDFTTKFLLSDYEEKLEEYIDLKNEENKNKRIIENTIRNMNERFHKWYNERNGNEIVEKQIGKFFQIWNNLSQSCIDDRLRSYSSYYVTNNLINKKIIEAYDKNKYIDKMFVFLLQKYNTAYLEYKTDIEWDSKNGIIKNINNIKFDVENDTFILDKQFESEILQNEDELNTLILNHIYENKTDKDLIQSLKSSYTLSKCEKNIISKKFKNMVCILDDVAKKSLMKKNKKLKKIDLKTKK